MRSTAPGSLLAFLAEVPDPRDAARARDLLVSLCILKN